MNQFTPQPNGLDPRGFAGHILKEIAFFMARGQPYIWNEGYHIFERYDAYEAEEWLASLIPPDYDGEIPARFIKETLRRLLRDKAHRADFDKLTDEAEHYILLNNGLYDLSNGTFLGGDQGFAKAKELKLMSCVDCNFVVNADLEQAPNFRKYLETSLGGAKDNPKAVLLLEIIGFLLSSLIGIRKMCILVGKSGTGKSVILEFIAKLIRPKSAVISLGIKEMTAKFNAPFLENAKVNICTEMDCGKIRNTAFLKKLISHEQLFCEPKGEKGYMSRSYAHLAFGANQLPTFAEMDSDGNRAMYNRMVILRFTDEISEDKADDKLPEKLLAEKDVIVSLAIKALQELVNHGGRFTEPEDSKALMETYIQENTSLKVFLEEYVGIDPVGKVHKKALVEFYRKWASDNALKPFTDKQVSEFIANAYSTAHHAKFVLDGQYRWGWTGISLKTEYHNEEK